MASSGGDEESVSIPNEYSADKVNEHLEMHDVRDGKPESPRQHNEPSRTYPRASTGTGTSKPPLSTITPVKRSASDMDARREHTVQTRNSSAHDLGRPYSMSPLMPEEAKGQVESGTKQLNVDVPCEQDASQILNDPDEPIDDFDWDDLTMRYHQTVKELSDQEAEILKEFAELSESFALWAQSGPKDEVESSYKRLKAQMRFVRNEEQDLEEKRIHYVNVVDAFKSALRLLGS